MHWKHVSPSAGRIWEPLELRELKKQLANVHCSCSFCKSYRKKSKQHCKQPVKELYKDQEMQSDHYVNYSKPVVFVVSDQTITEDSYLSTTKPTSVVTKDQVCPTCAFTLNLLRCGTTKTVKDEESEAKTEMSSSEKATSTIGKTVEYLNKTTSYTKPLLKYPLSTFSAVSSVDSVGSQNRSLREVTFAFNDEFYGYEDLNVSSDKTSAEKTTDDNSEEEEETASTSMETESEEEKLQPANKSLGVCANCVDINKYISIISPPGGPKFLADISE